MNRNKPNRPTTQPEDNGDNIDDTNNPRTHPDQVKNSKKGKRTPRAGGNTRVLNDPPLHPDIKMKIF